MTNEKQNKFEETIQPTDNYFLQPIKNDYKLSENCKTVTKYKGDDYIKIGLACAKTLKYDSIIEFAFKIEKADAFCVFIGFMEEGTSLEKGAGSEKTSWMCYLNDGRFINAGEKNEIFYDLNWSKPDQTSFIVIICIDTATDEMYLKINGPEITKKLKMKITDEQKQKLVPCVDFRKVGDKITII